MLPATVRLDVCDDTDVKKFMFMLYNVITLGKSDEFRSMEFMCQLKGATFDFYCEKFSRDGSETYEKKWCLVVKREFIDRFGMTQEPEDEIRYTKSASLDKEDLVKSLK